MTKVIRIDFVSDVSCPWCAVGLAGLEKALEKLAGKVTVDIAFQPFELNPSMPEQGQDIVEHLQQKYGSDEQQQAQTRQMICERGKLLGFEFNPEGRGRIWNTFDAHRLLYMAEREGQTGQQIALKKALLAACHTRSEAMNSHEVLLSCALASGLDKSRVQEVLTGDTFTNDVRERQQYYLSQGISGVPAVIFNQSLLVSGAQPVEIFEQALTQADAL